MTTFNKQTFEALIESTVPDSDYSTLEFVFHWNPALQRMDQDAAMGLLATIYKEAGMMMVKDLEWSAEYMCEKDTEIRKLQAQIVIRQTEIEQIREDAERWAENRD